MANSFPTPTLSRRDLLGSGAIAAGVVFCGGIAVPTALSAGTPAAAAPVVAFHRDALYLDRTGAAEPWRPRIATDWADALDDEALFRLGVAA